MNTKQFKVRAAILTLLRASAHLIDGADENDIEAVESTLSPRFLALHYEVDSAPPFQPSKYVFQYRIWRELRNTEDYAVVVRKTDSPSPEPKVDSQS